jgi:hypothetical protein
MDCAICLNSVRQTRGTPQLDCKHVFHTSCFNNWRSQGGTTCPLCRDHIQKSLYRVHIKIENIETGETQTNTFDRRIGGQELNGLERAEIIFDADELQEIHELIDGGFFGLSRSDFDTFTFNTQ